MKPFGVILLAAGQGTRMKSGIPKVLHPLAGKPLFLHVLATAKSLHPQRIAVVVGHGADAVRGAYSGGDVQWVLQAEQRGTAHAVLCAESVFDGFDGDVLILSGDVPMLTEGTLQELLRRHREREAAVTFLTARPERPAGYGRVVRGPGGEVERIVEEKDATEAEKAIGEVNAGVYVACARFLFRTLKRVGDRNRQREYYLPDVIGIGLAEGSRIEAVEARDAREALGVNTREELAAMEKSLQERINRKHMLAGVTLKDPQTTYIDEGVTIGRDSVIGPNTHLLGQTVIGEGCVVDGSAYLTDAEIGDRVHLRFSVVLTRCRVASGAIVGPFAHLRPGTDLGENVHIGNFVECKEARLGAGTKANHLTYLGDVTVGRETNIGAGTITCNYDGFRKYRTRIGDRVQVGSDTTLVAPVTLGDDVYVATATTVRRDVPAGALVFNERQERVREGWTAEKRRRMREGES
ncbi:MAG TPA: bifunctional UDP-N-acetylglucosamine diphosphorylase/glucosamine-1-phosphate N-acetyltransferase GlmU [candidate division Zixibacteria bacterium]|nr:bifunctional UDP-N-acetylglucosamine diphosphorylase/glucosamine-1-phosphate N-acetyltransferase GlmU [candidate division Zixibacteria bacterium]